MPCPLQGTCHISWMYHESQGPRSITYSLYSWQVHLASKEMSAKVAKACVTRGEAVKQIKL